MRLITISLPFLLCGLFALGCNAGSSTTTTPDLARDVQHGGSGPGPNSGPGGGPKLGCPQLFDVVISCTPDPLQPPMESKGIALVDTCVPKGANYDAILGLKSHEVPGQLKVRAIQDPLSNRLVWEGSRTQQKGNRQRGATITWTLRAGLTQNSVAPTLIEGTATRLRERWFTDRAGNRIEKTDTLACTFTGSEQ